MNENSNSAVRQTIELEPVLDMCAASPLAQLLCEKPRTDLVIDASNVERIGAQCAQVLIAAEKSWSAEGAKLEIGNFSTEFSDGMALLGLSTFMSQLSGGRA